jgi:hypothetical protein
LFRLHRQLLLANPAIPFDENTAIYKLMLDRSAPILAVFVQSGPALREVISPGIVSVARNNPPVPHRRDVPRPALMFQLTPGSEAFNNKRSLVVLLLNAFIAACSEDEHAAAVGEPPVFLQLTMYIDARSEGPYAYGYLRPVADALPDDQRIIRGCPPDRLCCEIYCLYRGHFVYFPRARLATREPVSLEDLTFVD